MIKINSDFSSFNLSRVLDYALILPQKFEDYTITKFPKNNSLCTVKVVLTDKKFTAGLLKETFKAFCETWNMDIDIVIFHPKPFHYKIFKSTIYIHGNCSIYNSRLQFINPKVVKEVETINPKYKLKKNDKDIQSFLQKYINYENLKNTGLNEFEINLLLKIHKNDQESIFIVNNLGVKTKMNDYEFADGVKNLKTLKFIEIFSHLKQLKSLKINHPAKKIQVFDLNPWIKSLPFTLTKDQLKTLQDIKKDLQKNIASRRVIMGDVGCGKTMVILGAGLMMYPKNCILMAPTTILAEQIYNEAKKYLPSFMNILLVKSGDKKNIDFTGANMIIGTHVLLYCKLPKTNLIMIDEQHRFGSNQRNQIDKMVRDDKFSPHFLQFSATPIPRTLNLIESELVNFSIIKQMPFKKNIKTKIIKKNDFNFLLKHIEAEIQNGNQTAIIYPIVESSENFKYQSLQEAKEYWQKKFDKVFVTYGSDKDKDEVLQNFAKDGNILLGTTLIEVGISLPKLTTIIISGPERLGLATLHQLRGRVGRIGNNGYCFLFTKLDEIPKRLIDFSNTMDGFEIAMIDLKNRKSGDLINGTIQHGMEFEFFDYEEDITELAKKRLSTIC